MIKTNLHFHLCPICNKECFSKKASSVFCSLECYRKSSRFKEIIKETHEKLKNRKPRTCLHCGKIDIVKASLSKRKFCSKICSREFMELRFDRNIQTIETMALPNNYDEFLTKEQLPCLIDGCDWVGHSLSKHMNAMHGITAAELKQYGGFNKGTGVISRSAQENLSKRNHIKGGNPDSLRPDIGGGTWKMSLEAKEHMKKAKIFHGKSEES